MIYFLIFGVLLGVYFSWYVVKDPPVWISSIRNWIADTITKKPPEA